MTERTFDVAIEETTPGAAPLDLRLTVSVEEMKQQPASWKPLRIGAGGWCTGMDIAPDGTMVTRTDTYGGYLWQEADDEWQQLVSLESMPAPPRGYAGILELCIAPSDSNVIYMMIADALFRSDDRGKRWLRTAVTFPEQDANSPKRFYGQKMAVHPSNPDVVLAGTQNAGVFLTRDGGKTSIKTNAPDATYITGIVFSADGQTAFLAAAEHGCYRSIDGGEIWAPIAGPINGDQATLDINGDYLLTDWAALHRYKDGAWKALYTTPGAHGVTVDPHNPGHIVTCLDSGSLCASRDNGETWTGQNWAYTGTAEGDIPWIDSGGAINGYMAVGRLMFDPVVPNRLWMSQGIGVCYTDDIEFVPDWSHQIVWRSQSRGIEQLCSNDICAPKGGKVLLASWDRPVFTKDEDDLNQYEDAYLPDRTVFSMGWCLDYASTDPSFVCGLVNYWGDNKHSGFTRDGKTWTPFAVQPAVNDGVGGSIAALTPDNILVAPANRQPATYTKDGGKTWAPIVLEGLPDWNGFHWAYYLKRRTVAADRVKPNTAYIYAVAETDSFGALYETVDGGDTFTRIYDGHIVPVDYYNSTLLAMPGRAGELWYGAGPQGARDPWQPMMRSTDAGRTWIKVEGIMQPHYFGFGAEGEVATAAYDGDGKNFGIYRSTDSGQTWEYLGLPLNRLDAIGAVGCDANVKGRVYVGFGGSGFAYRG